MNAPSKYLVGFAFSLLAAGAPVLAQDKSTTTQADEGLPDSAKAVLVKMEQFEEQTLFEAQVKIEKKRLDVVRYLENLLDEETRGGNLEGGVAIRNEIKRLKALPSAKLPKVSAEGRMEGDPSGEEAAVEEEKSAGMHLIVGRWAFEDKDGTPLVREFTSDGKCVQYRNGRKEWSLDYEVVNRREVDVVFLGALKFRHTVRGNGTLKTKEPDTVAQREKEADAPAKEEP